MNFKYVTPVLNVVLVVACVTHISITAYKKLYPDIPDVQEYKTDLGKRDFPVSVKICLKELKNKTERYQKYGFNNHWHFFYGYSKGRKDFIGWNGDFENKSVTVKGNS